MTMESRSQRGHESTVLAGLFRAGALLLAITAGMAIGILIHAADLAARGVSTPSPARADTAGYWLAQLAACIAAVLISVRDRLSGQERPNGWLPAGFCVVSAFFGILMVVSRLDSPYPEDRLPWVLDTIVGLMIFGYPVAVLTYYLARFLHLPLPRFRE
jgi:hypothetical protein